MRLPLVADGQSAAAGGESAAAAGQGAATGGQGGAASGKNNASRTVRSAAGAVLIVVAATAAMLLVRERLDKVHVALVYLLVVLVGSSMGGRALGFTLAAISFALFNWFFLPPYGTFYLHDPLDWIVLAAFLLTSVVATTLLYSAQAQSQAALERASEIDRLATLGAESLNAVHAADALNSVVAVIHGALGVELCELYASSAESARPQLSAAVNARGDASAAGTVPSEGELSLVHSVAENGVPVLEQKDGTVRIIDHALTASDLRSAAGGGISGVLIPLAVRHQTVGVLRLHSSAGLDLQGQQLRFLDAIGYYAALALERSRLASAAEQAEVLRASNTLKDAILASVSHDFRTPLASIKAMAHDLASLGDERAEIIEQETGRLSRMVDDLLDMSRLNAGVLPVSIELNAIDDLMVAVVQRVEPSLRQHTLRVRSDPEGSLLVGRFDLVHSLRILVNLVENAAKYTPANNEIEVEARAEDSEIAISVMDRGPGISAEERTRIFAPFYQAAAREGAVASGAGLGLAVAMGLATAQGGRLDYADRPGGGSVFTLHVPAVDIADIERRSRAQ